MSEAEMMMEWEEEIATGFRVVDDAGAAWCVRKIREAQDECDRMIMWYTAQIERAKKKCADTEERMKAYLQEYAETVPMKETKTQKSYPVPGGKLILKKATTKLEHDDQRIMEDLKRQGRTEYIKTVTTEKLDWSWLKKDYLENGEAVDGITVVDVPETFEVKVEA